MTLFDVDGFLARLGAIERPADAEYLYDDADPAGALRQRNLRTYFALMQRIAPRVLLVAEAPGYRGATVTGVPFMSCREISARPGLITGAPKGDGFEVPANPVAGWEASSAAVWAALRVWTGPLPMSWPIYPHHPFEPGDPLSNRTPRQAEIRAGAPLALELADAFGLELVAVGRKAQAELGRSGLSVPAVRHPAQGGAREFARQLGVLNGRPAE